MIRKPYKKQLEIETFKKRELRMHKLNSLLLRTEMNKEEFNVKNMKCNMNKTQSKEISKLE